MRLQIPFVFYWIRCNVEILNIVYVFVPIGRNNIMSISDLIKSKFKNILETQYKGRHQWQLKVKKLLGEHITTLEHQIAINKDNTEKSEIVKALDDIEKYIHSQEFTNTYDVKYAFDELLKIIRLGYSYCVLQLDPILQERALEKVFITCDYLKKVVMVNDPNIKEFTAFEDTVDALGIIGLTQLCTLGDLLDSDLEKSTWAILHGLNNPSIKIGRFAPLNLLSGSLTMLNQESTECMVVDHNYALLMLKRNGSLNAKHISKAESLIEEGFKEHKRLHSEVSNTVNNEIVKMPKYNEIINFNDSDFKPALLSRMKDDRNNLIAEMVDHEEKFHTAQNSLEGREVSKETMLILDLFKREKSAEILELLDNLSELTSVEKKVNLVDDAILAKAVTDHLIGKSS